jgi:CO/xanthine dehydrogenase Mo-binding subunit
MDIPGNQTLSSLEMPDPEGPFGAKEAGEGASAPVLASIANAISNAVGVRFTSLPITPEDIVKAIKEKGGWHGKSEKDPPGHSEGALAPVHR